MAWLRAGDRSTAGAHQDRHAGHDASVLRGRRATIRAATGLQLELPASLIYEGAASFSELVQQARSLGLRCWGPSLYTNIHGRLSPSGPTVSSPVRRRLPRRSQRRQRLANLRPEGSASRALRGRNAPNNRRSGASRIAAASSGAHGRSRSIGQQAAQEPNRRYTVRPTPTRAAVFEPTSSGQWGVGAPPARAVAWSALAPVAWRGQRGAICDQWTTMTTGRASGIVGSGQAASARPPRLLRVAFHRRHAPSSRRPGADAGPLVDLSRAGLDPQTVPRAVEMVHRPALRG